METMISVSVRKLGSVGRLSVPINSTLTIAGPMVCAETAVGFGVTRVALARGVILNAPRVGWALVCAEGVAVGRRVAVAEGSSRAAWLAATVTGNFAAASALFLSTNPNCVSSINSLTLNTAKTQATVAAGTIIASGIGEVVCMATGGTVPIPATTPAINIVLSTSAAAVQAGAPLAFGPFNLYALLPNGGTATVRAYIPAAATGYVDVVRIINVGQAASSISVSRIDPVTGTPGTPAVLPGGALAAGGATNYTASTIETALGGPFAAGDRPRLLFTANTSIEAQNYIVNPNGTLTTLHSKD